MTSKAFAEQFPLRLFNLFRLKYNTIKTYTLFLSKLYTIGTF